MPSHAGHSGDVDVVRAWVEGSQRARASGDPADFEALRKLLADDVEFRIAAAWGDEPWRIGYRGADAVLERLRAPSNAAVVLTTETVNLVQAGDDVLVEQVSTIARNGRDHRTCVAFVFTVRDGRISGVRIFRNDAGLPL